MRPRNTDLRLHSRITSSSTSLLLLVHHVLCVSMSAQVGIFHVKRNVLKYVIILFILYNVILPQSTSFFILLETEQGS